MSQQIPPVNRVPEQEQMEQEDDNLNQENVILQTIPVNMSNPSLAIRQPNQSRESLILQPQNQDNPLPQQQENVQQMDEQKHSSQINQNSQSQEQMQNQHKQVDHQQQVQVSSQQKNPKSNQNHMKQSEKIIEQQEIDNTKKIVESSERKNEIQNTNHQLQEKVLNIQQSKAIQISQKRQSMQTQSYINKLEKIIQQINQKYQKSQVKLQKKQVLLEESQKRAVQLVEQAEANRNKTRRYERMQELEKRNIDKLKREVSRLVKQIEQYQQIGDITVLKNRIQGLEALTKSQKQQIAILNQNIRGLKDSNQNDELNMEKVNVLQIIQQKNDNLTTKIEKLQLELKQKSLQNKELQTIIQQLNQQNAVRVQELEEKLNYEMDQVEMMKDRHATEILKLKEQVINRGVRGVQVVHKSLDQQEITAFFRDEKDLLMKQYLNLESQHLKLKEAYNEVKQKYFSSVRQSKVLSSMTVTKRQYEVVLQRYKKSKDCLQRNIKQLKTVKEELQALKQKKIVQQADQQLSEQQMINQDQVFGNQPRKISTFERQQQKQIADYHKTIKKHYNSYAQFMPKHLETKNSVQFIDAQSKLRDKQLECKRLQQELKQVSKLCRIYQSQIEFQKNLVDDMKDKIERIDRRKVAQIDNQGLQVQRACNQRKASILNVFQVQNLMLVNQNLRIRQQNKKWKDLYQNIKNNFQTVSEQKKSLLQRLQVQGQKVNLVQRMQIQEKLLQDAQKNLQIQPKKNSCLKVQVESQTDPIGEIYYKQIKDLLLILKRFPQKTQEILHGLQKIKEQLTLNSQRFEKQTQKLNLKFAEIKKQKSQNEKWRQNAKQEIKEEFQDVRELIENDRLIKVLKYAKSLIIEFEKENKENEDQVAEQGDSNQEGQNEQYKQNVSNDQEIQDENNQEKQNDEADKKQ